MRRSLLVLLSLFAVGLVAFFGFTSLYTASANSGKDGKDEFVSPHLVISQFQTAGGTANDEFIEIHNTSSTAVDLNGYRLVYRSAAGTNDVNFFAWSSSTIIPAGGYHLITSTAYDGSVPGDSVYNPSTCSCALSANGGGLAIRFGAANTGAIIDSVGYGTATNAFIETAVTGAPPANQGQARDNNRCDETDNNSADFVTLNPADPRNSTDSANPCSGGGTDLIASGAASPTIVAPLGTTLLTVSVFPATTPPSTGITVTGNLSNLGLSASQQFFDDGTNGDTTGGDNIFSYSVVIPENTPGGPVSVSAVASDEQARTAPVTINLTINAPPPNDDPLLLGNPSNATTDVQNENNYLMIKPQYSLAYSRATATPKWVAWRLDSSWIGTAPRQDDYRPDPDLPGSWYHVQDSDYSGSGYTRGHMCPSGDRTRSVPDNSATFLMTNFIPQIAENNSGPWQGLETYLRSLANSGKEIYIYSGGYGSLGTIAGGQVTVPAYTWKVALVLDNGNNDLARVNKNTRVIAVIMPNFLPLVPSTPWQNFRTSVNLVEARTGLNFFSKVPINTQELLERRKDTN
ncbi:MAG: DNA/RNA non-specific endonuclease [Pyrinomonadaceae bacterium]